MSNFSDILKDEVEGTRTKLTKTKLAKEVGISRTSLFNILKGRSLPKRSTLNGLLIAMETPQSPKDIIWQLFEAVRLRTVATARKIVTTAKDRLTSRIIDQLNRDGGVKTLLSTQYEREDTLGFQPDFWILDGEEDNKQIGLNLPHLRSHLFWNITWHLGDRGIPDSPRYPVYVETEVMDHYNLLGRALALRSRLGTKIPVLVCVPFITDLDKHFWEFLAEHSVFIDCVQNLLDTAKQRREDDLVKEIITKD